MMPLLGPAWQSHYLDLSALSWTSYDGAWYSHHNKLSILIKVFYSTLPFSGCSEVHEMTWGIFSENSLLGNCLILHVTFLEKVHFRWYTRPLDFQHSLARCSTANIFSAGKRKKKTVKLVSSGGNYQYQWILIFCFCTGDWQKYLKYESGFYP